VESLARRATAMHDKARLIVLAGLFSFAKFRDALALA